MYIETLNRAASQPHLATRVTSGLLWQPGSLAAWQILARGGQLDNDVLSLAHGPQTDDRPPCRLQKLADSCLRTLPSWLQLAGPGTLSTLFFRHPSAGYLLLDAGTVTSWEGSATARCLGGNSDMDSGRVG